MNFDTHSLIYIASIVVSLVVIFTVKTETVTAWFIRIALIGITVANTVHVHEYMFTN